MCISIFITQNIKSHEGTEFNKISTFNASSRTFLSETDFFFLLQLVQVVKNTMTASLVWSHGLSHAKATAVLPASVFSRARRMSTH